MSASTNVTAAQALTQSQFNLSTNGTAGFSPSGTLLVTNSAGAVQVVSYNSFLPDGAGFQGCQALLGGGGLASIGDLVAQAVPDILNSSSASEANVNWWGADPTGSTDCSNAFKAAFVGMSCGSVLHLPAGVYRLTADVTVPPGISLSFDGSTISVDPGYTLTVQGPIIAGSVQIFSGEGTSTFGGTQAFQELNVKWWGAEGNGGTDDNLAIQAALDAAENLVDTLSTVRQYPAGAYEYYNIGVTVYMPPGQYITGITLEQSLGVRLRGSGLVYISPTTATMQTLVILRCYGPFTDVEGISFSGGLTAIALGGGPLRDGSYMLANYEGAAPMNVQRCQFLYQFGPSIWQDPGPATTVSTAAELSAGAPTTLQVNSAFVQPGSFASNGGFYNDGVPAYPITPGGPGTLVIYVGPPGYVQATYTGPPPDENTISGVQLQAAAGGPSTIPAGSVVSLPQNNRTTQYFLVVDHCHFIGPCFFWGSGDTIQFRNCQLQPDWASLAAPGCQGYPGYPVSTDGVPLGLFNSADVLVIEGCAFDPNGFDGPARRSLFVGAGILTLRTCHSTDLTGLCSIRLAVQNNAWQGGAGAPMYLAGYPTSSVVGTSLCIEDFAFVNSVGAYWLECHDSIPAKIDLLPQGSGLFPETYGVWVDEGLSLQSLILDQVCAPMASSDLNAISGWRCPGNPDAYAAFQVTQGPDGPTTVLAQSVTLPGSTNVQFQVAVTNASAFIQPPPGGTLSFTVCGQLVSYAGIDGNTFTGCKTSGTGIFPSGTIVTATPQRGAGSDVTSYFLPFIEFPTRSRSPMQGIAAKNLMPSGIISLANCTQINATGATTTRDNSTGYPLWVFNYGSPGGILAYSTPQIPAPSDGALPAGMYCYSFYVYATADCTVGTSIQYFIDGQPCTPEPGGLNTERVFGICRPSPPQPPDALLPHVQCQPPCWQRISVPFYFPGGLGMSLIMSMGSWDVKPNSSLSYGLFQLNQGVVPTPYRAPQNVGPAGGVGNFVRQEYFGTASPTDPTNPAPIADYYNVGDIVWNTAPAQGTCVGWVCTTAGYIGGPPTCVFGPFGTVS